MARVCWQLGAPPKRRVEPLVYSVLEASSLPRDLLGIEGVDTSPTIVRAEGFRSFLWMGWKSGSADLLLFTVCGNGQAWLEAFSTTVSGSAGGWFRAELKPPRLFPAYRFIVVSSGVQVVRSKLIGLMQEVF